MMYTLDQLLNTFKSTKMKYMVTFRKRGEKLYSNAIFIDLLTLRLIRLIYNAVKIGYEYEVYDQSGNQISLLAMDLPIVKSDDSSFTSHVHHRGFM